MELCLVLKAYPMMPHGRPGAGSKTCNHTRCACTHLEYAFGVRIWSTMPWYGLQQAGTLHAGNWLLMSPISTSEYIILLFPLINYCLNLEQTCPRAYVSPHATITNPEECPATQQVPSGSTCRYVCQVGHVLTGSSEMSCGLDGDWGFTISILWRWATES